MEKMALEHSIWLDAPRERIWQALTEPSQIIQWFTPALPGGQMTLDGSGKLIVQLGPITIDFALLEAVHEPQQLTLRTLPDRRITTTYTLSSENNGTQLQAKTTGFEALVLSKQTKSLNLNNAAWEKTLKNLQAFVAGVELPFPQAFVSPLFGFWRETRNTLASERSIWIKASRERVWTAITDPQQLQLWLSPATPWELSSLELGGRFFVRDAETNAETNVEVIELLDPPHELATRSIAEGNIVKGKTYTLTEEDGGTRLTVTFSGYEQDAEETRWGNMEQNTFGFGMMLQNAKAFIEGAELPFPWGF
jgi:uncharacterized protein YndB with AHSA1/START domain